MHEGPARPRTRTDNRYPRRPTRGAISRRPDRVALWAFGMAVAVMVVAAASAHAGSGGTGTTATCPDSQFGKRTLRLGDCGGDVKTLNWLLRAGSYGVPLKKDFKSPTDDSVRTFQRRHDMDVDGVVGKRTRRKVVHTTMNRDMATWYGPGFFGSRTACGKVLRRRTVGVANRRLPCGTKVVLGYKHRYVRAKVIDRGPYAHGAKWDLTQKTARQLRFTTTDRLRVAKVR